MAGKVVNPTRFELESLKQKLMSARRGHKLLKDKRDGLMREFLDFVKKSKILRDKIEKKISKSNKNFALAKATMGESSVRSALMMSSQEASIEVKTKNLLSVNIPEFKLVSRINKKEAARSYGFFFTSSDLDLAVDSLSGILEDMLELASFEKSCYLIASEIEKTRRRVNALEHIVIPETLENIKYISMKLCENERATNVRLLKVKDMIISANLEKS